MTEVMLPGNLAYAICRDVIADVNEAIHDITDYDAYWDIRRYLHKAVNVALAQPADFEIAERWL